MNKIAVLLTCHNRKDKTLSCLKSLYRAYENNDADLEIIIYLTDDGSTDGTKEAVSQLYPEVNILIGNGNLYWAGGMRNSWNEALKTDFDGYLLLNDDTNVAMNVFDQLFKVNKHSFTTYGFGGIYIGFTHDGNYSVTYGGSVIINKFLFSAQRLVPNGKIEECNLGNANIMLVSQDAVNKIGILSEEYIHGIADYDYIIMAGKKDVPVLTTTDYCGICLKDKPNHYEKFVNLTYKERKKYLFNPTTLALGDNINLMKKFYPYRLPFVYVAAYFKLLFPKVYVSINKLR